MAEIKFKKQTWQDDYKDNPKYLLQLHHRSLQNAARIMEMDYSQLSRILSGKPHSLEDHLKILIACKVLPEDITMPRMDMQTFLLLNKDHLNNKIKRELQKYM